MELKIKFAACLQSVVTQVSLFEYILDEGAVAHSGHRNAIISNKNINPMLAYTAHFLLDV